MSPRGAVIATVVTLAATILLFLSVQHPNPPPTLSPGQATPSAQPYVEEADAQAAVDFAFAQARQNGHKVLLDFGNNSSPDARMLGGVMDDPKVVDWLSNGFETVHIDVGHLDRNLDIAAKWDVKIITVPTVLVLTPPGRLLNRDDTAGLANAHALSAQAVVDELGKMSRS